MGRVPDVGVLHITGVNLSLETPCTSDAWFSPRKPRSGHRGQYNSVLLLMWRPYWIVNCLRQVLICELMIPMEVTPCQYGGHDVLEQVR